MIEATLPSRVRRTPTPNTALSTLDMHGREQDTCQIQIPEMSLLARCGANPGAPADTDWPSTPDISRSASLQGVGEEGFGGAHALAQAPSVFGEPIPLRDAGLVAP